MLVTAYVKLLDGSRNIHSGYTAILIKINLEDWFILYSGAGVGLIVKYYNIRSCVLA